MIGNLWIANLNYHAIITSNYSKLIMRVGGSGGGAMVFGGGGEHGTSNVLTYHQFRFRGGSDLKLEIICLSINSIYKADQCQTILATKLKSLFRDKMNENEKLVATLQPKPTFNRKYRRLDKPPYTYVAMTTLAIQASPQRRSYILTCKNSVSN